MNNEKIQFDHYVENIYIPKDFKSAKQLYENHRLTSVQYIGILKELAKSMDDVEVCPDYFEELINLRNYGLDWSSLSDRAK